MFKIKPAATYRSLNRLRQIIQILVKHGFSESLDQLRVWEHSHLTRRDYKHGKEHPLYTWPERLRLALEELGPTFVKLGQVMSTRPDITPKSFITELEKLQNQVSPVPTPEIKKVIEEELGRPLEEVFDSFDDTPVAAASLSQVHRATLKTRECVAVKVQRPGITEVIKSDIEILNTLMNFAENQLKAFGISDPPELVREFSHNIMLELDFRREATNLKHYKDNMRKHDYLYIPKVYDKFCTEKLLVMEFMEGIEIYKTDRLKEEGYDLELIAYRCADAGLETTLEHGFFHADPHPGNIFVLPDNRICMLDFGMMGTVSENQREKLSWLIHYISRSDEVRATRALLDLSEASGEVNIKSLEIKAGNLIAEYGNLPLNKLKLGNLLSNLWQLMKDHGLHFDTHLIWLLKAVSTSEDNAHRLEADFNFIEYAKPYVRHVIRQSFSPIRQIRELQLTIMELMETAKYFPYEARRLIAKITGGTLKIEFEHIGLEPLRRTLNQISNRLSVSVILASLIIGSSLIVHSGIPPLVGNIPVVGLTGYIISGIISFGLVISILRSSNK